jgi:uncharacterized membrane protein
MLNSLLSKLILNDVKTGKPSYTVTAFVIGFLVVNVKLIFSGIAFGDHFTFSQFSGVDYAACVAALGAIYVARKNSTIKSDEAKDE